MSRRVIYKTICLKNNKVIKVGEKLPEGYYYGMKPRN